MSRKAPEIDPKHAETISFGGFAFLTKSRELRTAEGKAVDLRSQSAEVLSVLASRPSEIVSKDALMQAVWPDTFVTDDSLTQCIADVRRALHDDEHVILETFPKRGYRLNADRVHRRLTTVLAADAVGYSRLIGRDEEGTLATLKAYRQVFDRLIEQHGGRVFGSAGDSVVAEFASPVEAVRCATEIQFEVDRRNAGLPEPNRLRFRIGINLGDVVVEGDNLMGDGVNVAARLEAVSRPGGICISDAVYTHAHDRLPLEFVDMGEHKVKNIARPVHVYRVPLACEAQARSPFRGLEAFEFENAELFFGRARAIVACTERLEQQAASGKAFLLIYGMSGSGKSSLLRAGLLPSITRPGAGAGIEFWRRCLIRPSDGSDPVSSLAAGLIREGALPELACEPAVLAQICRVSPDRALASIRQALAQAAAGAGSAPSQMRFIVAIDQMEELFTTEDEPTSSEALVRLLAALASSGLAWVIATIRS